MVFRDRQEAGELLAEKLQGYQGADTVVYALPRGGVPLGKIIAKALHAPLDLAIIRKIGHPSNAEYAICAIAENGSLICNEAERSMVDETWLSAAINQAKQEMERRRNQYLAGRERIPAHGKVAIIVDDGIATGLTIRAAIQDIKQQQPKTVIVAVPVIPRETAHLLRQEVNEVVAVDIPTEFMGAVGAYYLDFHPINDAEVMEALQADPLLYYISTYDRLANELLNDRLQTGHWVSGRYANNERYVTLDSDPQEATCFVLSTIMPPDENILTTLLLSHTLKHHGATRVTALLPYMAYMRQEREEDRHSKATQWVGQITKASGIDAIISVDVHSEEAVGVLGVPLIQLSPFMLFANQIEKIGWHTATLVAPDQGAVHRCEAVRDAGKFTTPIAYFEKKRTPDGVHSTLHGDVSRRAIVIDDILDTGGTLIACCTGLLEAGVEQIIVMVTHGLFTGDKWQQLWQMGVQTIYVTNTVPLPERLANDNIRVLSIAPLLRDAIRDLSRL